MKKKVIIWVALWSSITMLSAQTSVNLVQEDDVCSDGIMYKLPLTTLVLQADVVQVIEKQGPFYKYTERFLGMTDFITESKTDWQLQGVRVFYRTEPDNTKCYHIAINKKTTAFNVELDSKGVIRTINQRTHTKPNRSKKSEPVAVDTVIRFDLLNWEKRLWFPVLSRRWQKWPPSKFIIFEKVVPICYQVIMKNFQTVYHLR